MEYSSYFLSNNCIQIRLPLNNNKLSRDILIVGNTFGLFGSFSEEGCMQANYNDVHACYNYQWLRKEIKAGSTITIISEKSILSDYYQRVYNGLFKDLPKQTKDHLKPRSLERFYKKTKKNNDKYKGFLRYLHENASYKYDIILCVPPYDKTSSGEEFKTIEAIIPLLKDKNSICQCIMPYNWLLDPYKRLKNGHYKSHLELTKHIRNIEMGIYSKSLYNNANLGIYEITKEELDYYHILTYLQGHLLHRVAQFTFNNTIPIGEDNTSGIDGWEVKWCGQEFFNPNVKGSEKLRNLEYSYNSPKRVKMQIGFSSEIECQNFCNSLKTDFITYFSQYSLKECRGLNISRRVAPWMGDEINPRTGLKGYNSDWTDEDFYTFFNVTDEEQRMIEDELS